MTSHPDKSMPDSDPSVPPEPIEAYSFIHKFPSTPPILYCFTPHNLPKPPMTISAETLSLLDSVNPEVSASVNPKKKKFEEESKLKSALPAFKTKLRMESVRAAVKVALKCNKESGYEQQQGFAENMKTLAKDMGILNTVKFVFPKIPMLLVCNFDVFNHKKHRIKKMKKSK